MAILKSEDARHSLRWEGDKLRLLWHNNEKGLTALDVELTDEQAAELVQDVSRARANRRKQLARAATEPQPRYPVDGMKEVQLGESGSFALVDDGEDKDNE